MRLKSSITMFFSYNHVRNTIGCNPKPKNEEGDTAKVIAKDNGHKDALKECKKAEKSFGKLGKNNDPWALALYDVCTEKEGTVSR